MAVVITDFTSNVSTDSNNVVTGDGYFDDIMESVNSHIDAQYNLNRITGVEYSTVYLGAMQSAIQAALQLTLEHESVDSKNALSDAQKLLVDRQKKGFDDDAKQKLLKQALDSWSVAYSVAQDANAIPDAIKVDSIDQIMKNAMDNLAILPTTPTVNTAKKTDTNPLGIA